MATILGREVRVEIVESWPTAEYGRPPGVMHRVRAPNGRTYRVLDREVSG